MKPSKKNPLVISFLGKPGSGKGTQAKLLMQKFGLEYFGSGDALRQRQKKNDFSGEKLGRGLLTGKLSPVFIVANLWIDALEKSKQKRGFKGIILDGNPRRVIEAQLLDDALDWYEWDKNSKTILIDISEKESFWRLTKRRQCKKCKRLIPWVGEFKQLKKCDKCGGALVTRKDDKIAAIKKRLQEYKEQVIPVLDYYNKKKRLLKINGEQSIEDVFKDILKAL